MTERGEDIIRQVERKRKGAKPGPKPKRKKPEGSGRKPLPPEQKRARLYIRLNPGVDVWLEEEIYQRLLRRPNGAPLPTPSEVIADAIDLYRGQARDWRHETETILNALWSLGYFVRELRQQFRARKVGNRDLTGDLDGVLERLVKLSEAYEQSFRAPDGSFVDKQEGAK